MGSSSNANVFGGLTSQCSTPPVKYHSAANSFAGAGGSPWRSPYGTPASSAHTSPALGPATASPMSAMLDSLGPGTAGSPGAHPDISALKAHAKGSMRRSNFSLAIAVLSEAAVLVGPASEAELAESINGAGAGAGDGGMDGAWMLTDDSPPPTITNQPVPGPAVEAMTSVLCLRSLCYLQRAWRGDAYSALLDANDALRLAPAKQRSCYRKAQALHALKLCSAALQLIDCFLHNHSSPARPLPFVSVPGRSGEDGVDQRERERGPPGHACPSCSGCADCRAEAGTPAAAA